MSLLLAQPPIVTGAPTSHGRPRVLFAYMLGWLLSCAPVTAQSQPFAETIAQTRGAFQPVTQENVLQAVSKVRQGLHAIENDVVTEGQNAAAWKRSLDWDEQKDRLNPNVVVRLPEQLLKRMPNEPIEVDFPVNDCIGGAAVRGTSHLSATRSLSLVPSASRLKIRTEIAGTTYSTTTGTKDRVTVCTTGDLRFNSTAEIFFDMEGFALAPFKTFAQLQTRITGINSDYWIRLRRNAARRKAYARREADRRQQNETPSPH